MQRTRNLFRFCALLLLVAAGPVARAEFFEQPWIDHHENEGVFSILPSFDYYTSAINYDATGAPYYPAGLQAYTRMQVDANFLYGLGTDLTLYGRASWARVEVDGSNRPGVNYGFTDQAAGLNFRVLGGGAGKAQLAIQGQADIPAYNNAAAISGNFPGLGDGTYDFTGGLVLSGLVWESPSGSLTLSGAAGYTYRTAGFSAAVPWSASADFVPKHGLLASAMLWGYQSLVTDSRGLAVSTFNSLLTGGSFATNAVDPSLVGFRAKLGYLFSEGDSAYVQAGLPIRGMAAPYGANLIAGLELRLTPSSSQQNTPSRLTSASYGRSNQGFVTYDLDAQLSTGSDLRQLSINKGLQDGVAVGQVFDIFRMKQDGSVGEAVARARVISVSPTSANLAISEFYREIKIGSGFMAKRPVQ